MTDDSHILVVEDDARLRTLLGRLLRDDRHTVDLASCADEALAIVESGAKLDAMILDVMLPDRSGLEVARALRASGSSLSILMLTARDAIGDRVAGLVAGADDYLVKPFAYDELSARLRALGRRETTWSHRDGVSALTCGCIRLDERTHEVTVAGRPVSLSRREFSVLECLLRHRGQVLTRDQLIDHAWPFGIAVTPNSVDAYVKLVRRKLGAEGGALIETVRGVGYRAARA
jgi:two-component system, OmpR family, response regulator MprA